MDGHGLIRSWKWSGSSRMKLSRCIYNNNDEEALVGGLGANQDEEVVGNTCAPVMA